MNRSLCTFENIKRSSVTVTKYGDGDRDGQLGTSEVPLPGWSFFIDANGNSRKDGAEATAVTDAFGRAKFADLAPGTAYRICEVVTAGWVNTDPGSNTQPCKTTAALAPGDDSGLLFGNASALPSGARTIGFWRNKNGQSIISSNCLGADRTSGTADDLRGYLRALRPFQDLSETATCSKIATYASDVIDRATKNKVNDSTNMNAMLKAQMLAAALNAYFSDPTLGGNRLGAPHPIGGLTIDLLHVCAMVDDTGGSSVCVSIEDASSAFNDQATMTVTQMLNWAAAQATAATAANRLASPWYGQDRALQRLAKDSFDAINNGVAFSVTP